MKKMLMALWITILFLSNTCSADVYTKKMSNLGAVRFIQEYNSATYNEHGKINYFVNPERDTPSNWKNIWPYDLWRSVSVDNKYRLEITVDKQGYVTKIQIICVYNSDINNAANLIVRMLNTSSFLTGKQIEYLMANIKLKGNYYISDVNVNNQTRIAFIHAYGSDTIEVMGASPYD